MDVRAQGRPSIVVCPTSLLENWADESRRYTPDLKVLVIHGTDRRKWINDLDSIRFSYHVLRAAAARY